MVKNDGKVYAVQKNWREDRGLPKEWHRQNGEVDYLIDDYDNMTVSPIEVKSGRDYKIHSAINKFISNESYKVAKAYVFSNERNVFEENGIIYLPIYYIMYFKA